MPRRFRCRPRDPAVRRGLGSRPSSRRCAAPSVRGGPGTRTRLAPEGPAHPQWEQTRCVLGSSPSMDPFDVRSCTTRTRPRPFSEYSRNHPRALLALTTHGRTGLARLTAGSVAIAVVRETLAARCCSHDQPGSADRHVDATPRSAVELLDAIMNLCGLPSRSREVLLHRPARTSRRAATPRSHVAGTRRPLVHDRSPLTPHRSARSKAPKISTIPRRCSSTACSSWRVRTSRPRSPG